MRRLVYGLLLVSLFSFPVFSQEDATEETEDTTKLGKVVVTATRTEVKKENTTQSIQVITSGDIEKTDATELTDLLKKTAGVDVIEYPGGLSGIGMRGFRAEYGLGTARTRTLVLIDGRPAGALNLATVSLNNVERIEVLKGSGSSVYGSGAMAGVVNIITKTSKGKMKTSATIGGGSYKTWYAGITSGGDVMGFFDFDLTANVKQQLGDQYVGDENIKNNFKSFQNGEKLDPSDNTKYNGSLRIGKDFGKWRFDLGGNVDIQKDVYCPPAQYSATGDPSLKDLERYGADFRASGKITELNNLKFTTYATREANHYLDLDVKKEWSSKTQNIYGASLIDSQSFVFGSNSLTFSLGADFQREKSATLTWDQSTFERTRPYYPDEITDTIGIFGEVEAYLLDEKVILNAGLRYDRITVQLQDTAYYPSSGFSNDKNTMESYNPSAGIKVKPFEFLNIHSTVGTAFVAPDAIHLAEHYEMAYNMGGYSGVTDYYGDPDINPEKSLTYDVGIGGSLKRAGLSYDITYFHTDVDDKISTKTVGSAQYYVNADSAEMSGVETELSMDVGMLAGLKQSVRFFVNYTEMLKYDQTVDGETSDISNIRDKKINAGIDYDDNEMLSMRLSYRYLGEQYAKNNYKAGKPTEKVSDFWVMDYSVSFKIGEMHKVNVKVSNIFDKYYYEMLGYGMPGRTIYADYTISI